MTPVLHTARLVLRPWREDDLAPFAALCADAQVMAHFPSPLTRAESDASIARYRMRSDRDGIGFAAVERRSDGCFLGMAGLSYVDFAAPVRGAHEIGWRFARAHWGAGLATEAATAWLAHGFGALALSEIVAFTTPGNTRSRAVMARLGMARDPARDFDTPARPPHAPEAVVTYALSRPPEPRA